jgi:outer membrane protein
MAIRRIMLIAVLASLYASPTAAREGGDIMARLTLLTSQPDVDGQSMQVQGQQRDLEVAEDTMPGLSAGYAFNEWIGVGLATSLPLEHNLLMDDSSGAGSGLVGRFGAISPHATLELYAPTVAGFHPRLGLGVHYTSFFEEDIRNQNARGLPASSRLEMDSSTGFVGRVGVDYDLGDWFLSASLSSFAMETTTTIRDNNTGQTLAEKDVELDPLQFQVGVAHRF